MTKVLQFQLALTQAAQSQLRAEHYAVRIQTGVFKSRQVYRGGLPEHGGVPYTQDELQADEVATMQRHIHLAEAHIEHAQEILSSMEIT